MGVYGNTFESGPAHRRKWLCKLRWRQLELSTGNPMCPIRSGRPFTPDEIRSSAPQLPSGSEHVPNTTGEPIQVQNPPNNFLSNAAHFLRAAEPENSPPSHRPHRSSSHMTALSSLPHLHHFHRFQPALVCQVDPDGCFLSAYPARPFAPPIINQKSGPQSQTKIAKFCRFKLQLKNSVVWPEQLLSNSLDSRPKLVVKPP